MDTLKMLPERYGIPPMEDLLLAAPRMDVQICLVVIHTICWFFLVNYVFKAIAISIIRNLQNKERFISFHRDSYKKILGMDIGANEEEEIEFIAEGEGTITQHGIGGSLCLPSALGFGYLFPTGIASAMACHGSLTEIGTEVEDMLCRVYAMIYGGEKGRNKSPASLWFFLICHHSVACLLVIPMNVFYGHNSYYHEMSMWLQLAAFLAFMIQQYGYLLDIKTPGGLMEMKMSVAIAWVIMVWTRVVRYFWLCKILFDVLWEDQNWTVLYLSIVPFLGLTLCNVVFVMDASVKLVKFMPMQIKKHSDEEIKDLAVQAAFAGRHKRTRQSISIGLSFSQKEWAKVKGCVKMGVFHEIKKAKKNE